MAKQAGLHGIRGKVGNHSYYSSKNGGELMRSINEGMSERVKKDIAFDNTRKNMAEFGACAASAGAVLKAISQRWRFILNAASIGVFTKVLYDAMMKDTSHAWGQREIPTADLVVYQDFITRISKNQFPSEIVQFLKEKMHYTVFNQSVTVATTYFPSQDLVNYFLSLGADVLTIKLYSVRSTPPTFDNTLQGYSQPTIELSDLSVFEEICDLHNVFNEELISSGYKQYSYHLVNEIHAVQGVLAILIPQKAVGGTRYTLQKYCSAAFVECSTN